MKFENTKLKTQRFERLVFHLP